MKKLSIIIAMLAATTHLFAQQASTKEIVFVGDFTSAQTVSDQFVQALRSKVVEGLNDQKRLVIKDVNSDSQYQAEKAKRTEDASVSEKEFGFNILKGLNARYLIQGEVTRAEAVKEKSSDGSVTYKGALDFALSIIDVASGTITGTKTFSNSGGGLLGSLTGGTGSTPEAAIAGCAGMAKSSMEAFVDENFPMKGAILEVSSEKKGKAEEVYIDLGSNSGLNESTRFVVYEEKTAAGRKIRKEIGQLKVKSVEGEDAALCKVTKGGDVILKKIQELGENETLSIQSRPKGLFE